MQISEATKERRRRVAIANVIACTKKMQAILPNIGASYRELAGGCVAFHGIDAASTCATGIGSTGPVSSADLDEIEDFFRNRRVNTSVFNVADAADESLFKLLDARGYILEHVVQRWSHALRVIPAVSIREHIQVRPATTDEQDMWASVVARGFHDHHPDRRLLDIFISLGFADSCQPFMASIDQVVVGGGVLVLRDGLASLRTTSVLPDFRNRGVQKRLIQSRMNAVLGRAELISAATKLSGPSAKNMNDFGFFKDGQTKTFWRQIS